jgi:hypothetical protein
MDRLLVEFIRHRIRGQRDTDLGELIDVAERYFKGLQPRDFFEALRAAQRFRGAHSYQQRARLESRPDC